MIKLIIFDLDGVVVDARELHYNALNKALESIFMGNPNRELSDIELLNRDYYQGRYCNFDDYGNSYFNWEEHK